MSGEPGLTEGKRLLLGWRIGMWVHRGQMKIRDKIPRNFTVCLWVGPTTQGFSSEMQIEIIKEEERHTLFHPAL